MDIKSLTPCNDWYFVAKGTRDEDIVFRVAAWALLQNSDVIGLISASGAGTETNVARLVAPPPIKGMYIAGDQLTPSQRGQAKLY